MNQPNPELNLGNIVKLKKPYQKVYTHGIIVEHCDQNAWSIPKVCLHLFDDKGSLHMMDGQKVRVPCYCDFCASEFVVTVIAGSKGHVIPDGHDLYPLCQHCKGIDQHPFGDNKCNHCGGWGHEPEMRRYEK